MLSHILVKVTPWRLWLWIRQFKHFLSRICVLPAPPGFSGRYTYCNICNSGMRGDHKVKEYRSTWSCGICGIGKDAWVEGRNPSKHILNAQHISSQSMVIHRAVSRTNLLQRENLQFNNLLLNINNYPVSHATIFIYHAAV